ncbi:hypothetical protein Cgig2_028211 [Carnegiea gigantea]|uniref:Reverse transcriptase zinc-binding domain-containing protein n=1 Tax=Carnegiea gigantea TaxID=171969 RepID=A0A9Q1GUZ1_9CARY|nr:hypothetical protein Cgig2_028211 [Carnegiea gigantea]
MATGLKEDWQRLKLTEEEEEIAICDEEILSEKVEQVALCLLGKLHTESYFNPGALKMVLKNAGKPSNGERLRGAMRLRYVGLIGLLTLEWIKLGHVYKGCVLFDEKLSEDKLQCGHWLRASPLKPKGKNVEAELLDERRLIQAYRNKKTESGAKKKLYFDATSSGSITVDTMETEKVRLLVNPSSTEVSVNSKVEAAQQPRLLQRVFCASTTGGWVRPRQSTTFVAFHGGYRPSNVDLEWRFTSIYGWFETQHKLKTGPMVLDLYLRSSLPWLVGGDLKEIFYNTEKGGPSRLRFVQLGFSGHEYTWWNGRQDDGSVEERLDRFCANTDWSLIFLEAQVTHVDFEMSDHMPILLRTKPVHSDVVDNFLAKIEICSKELAKWNTATFGNVRLEIKKFELQLKSKIDAANRRSILTSISEWRKKEEVLWWQRARSNYLKYEDSNMRWFHSQASMRRARNHTDGFLDDANIITTKPEEFINLKVRDLIEFEAGTWRESHIREIFLPCDAEAILDIPPCVSWPANKLIWHFTATGVFTVQLAYHMRLNWVDAMSSSSENRSSKMWKMLWALDAPPRIRLNIAKRVPSFVMSCAICGATEESDVHVLLECPLAVVIWVGEATILGHQSEADGGLHQVGHD